MDKKSAGSSSGHGSGDHGQGAYRYNSITYENDISSLSPESRATVEKIHRRRRRSSLQEGTRCSIHDNTSNYYSWLLPGWVAEERHMKSGRIYRYYYDPMGQMYSSQHEVLNAYEDNGLIVLDI